MRTTRHSLILFHHKRQQNKALGSSSLVMCDAPSVLDVGESVLGPVAHAVEFLVVRDGDIAAQGAPSVWFTFPSPPNKSLTKLDPLATAILDARAAHPGATLATLYDPDLMPPNLRAAHAALDRAVDRLYRPAGFATDRERVEPLFALYEAQVAPLLARPKKRR